MIRLIRLPQCLTLLLIGVSSMFAETPVPAPSQIETLLMSANSFDRTDTEALFGLNCHNYMSVKQHSVTLSVGRQTVLLEVEGCETKNLIVVEHKHGKWFFESRIPFSLHYDQQPTVTFENLINKGEKEIIVKHHIVDWGTGLQQINMSVLKLFGDRLEVIFDQPEKLHVTGPGVGDKVIDQEQVSRFSLESNADSNTPGRYSIMEVETIKSSTTSRHSEAAPDKKTIIRWWAHVWQPDIRRFRRIPNFGF